jgi:MarR family transcriptional regulator, organic hydroperoxide resistance regulator
MHTDLNRRPKRRAPARAGTSPPRTRTTESQRARLTRTVRELRALQCFRTIFGSARVYDAEVRRTGGISGSQLWALAEVAGQDGMTVNRLAERMALHQSTASNLVNALVERGLIRRLRDSADQRVVHLHVAPEGKRMLLRIPGPHAGLLVDAIRRLDEAQLEELRGALGVLVGIMHSTAAAAAGETLLGE